MAAVTLLASRVSLLVPRSLQPLQPRHRHRDRPPLLFHDAAEEERPLVEEHMGALAVDVGEHHRLDQAVAVVEGGELHRLVPGGVDRLGGGEHPGAEHRLAHVPVEFGAGGDPPAPEPLAVELHGVGIGGEAEQGVGVLAAAGLRVLREKGCLGMGNGE